MKKSAFASVCLSSLAMACMAVPAHAQSSDETPAGPEDEAAISGGMWSGDIIVTARRREETAQDTPVAMTVLGDELLDRYAVRGIEGIESFTPGLVIGEVSGSVGGSISLRGVGSGDSQAFFDQAVSVNVDGVQISTAQILRAAQMDLQQIEVLRGPQALFFGKNSPGGIISVTTASPGNELELMVRGGYEFDAEEKYFDAVISTPLTDTLGLRLAAHYADMNGYIDVISPPTPGVTPSGLDAYPNREELFLRGTVAFEPTDRLDISLKATYTDTQIKGGPSYFSDIVFCPYGLPQEGIPVASNCENDGVIVTAQIPQSTLALNSNLEPNGHRDNQQLLLTGTINLDLSDTLTLTSVTGYYDVDEDLSSNGGYGLVASNVFAVQYANEQISQELRLASDYGGAFDFVVGGLFEDRELFTQTYIVVPPFGNFELPIESTNQDQQTYSGFGQLIFRPTEEIEITAGGRYTHEVKNLVDYNVAVANFGTPVVTEPLVDITADPAYPGPTRLTFDNFSPEITITYEPRPQLLLYASYKQGYKSGGFDGAYTAGAVLAGGVNSYEPEEVSGGEIGLKSRIFDRQVTFNLAGYWYDYQDLQVSTYDTNARSFSTGNAAEALVRGVEVELAFQPNAIPDLQLYATAAYNDAEFEEYLAGCYNGQSQALGCNQDIDPITGIANTQDLSGVQLRKAPEFTATLGGYYEQPLGANLMASVSSNLMYSGSYNYGTDYQPFANQGDFAKLDATFRLFTPDERWELALIGRNLTNVRNLNNGIDRTGTGGASGTTAPTCTTVSPAAPAGCETLPDLIGTPARPRSVALQLTYRY